MSKATSGSARLPIFLIAVLGVAALALLISLFILVQGHVRDIDRRALELREAQAEVEGLERQGRNLLQRIDELNRDRDEGQKTRDRALEPDSKVSQ